MEPAARLICQELLQAGRTELATRLLEPDEVPEFRTAERRKCTAPVSSLRLDAVLAAMLRCSRGQASELVTAGRVEINHLPADIYTQRAEEAGSDETILHRGDRVTEGAHSGLAILKDGVFCTPPADNLILPSITRKHFLTLCDKLGVPTRIAPFTVDELKNADEVMILSTGTRCVGACELDGKPLGGKDPALLDKLQKAYQQWFNEETAK